MDTGDIIYIVLFIAISGVSALSKLKKKQAAESTQSTENKRSILADFFEEVSENDDPVMQQMEREEQDFYAEEEVEEITPPVEQSLSHRKAKTAVSSSPEKVTSENRKYHSVVNDLRKKNEARRAVIYSEILKTKF